MPWTMGMCQEGEGRGRRRKRRMNWLFATRIELKEHIASPLRMLCRSFKNVRTSLTCSSCLYKYVLSASWLLRVCVKFCIR